MKNLIRLIIATFGIFHLCVHSSPSEDWKNVCGFPGAPAYGKTTPDKELYQYNEKVQILCNDGYFLDGLDFNQCLSTTKWMNLIPTCRKDVAYKRPASQSSIFNGFEASFAVDGNVLTCSKTENDIYHKAFWKVNLEEQYEINSVRILAHADKRITQASSFGEVFSLSIKIENPQSQSLMICNELHSNESTINEIINCRKRKSFPIGSEIRISNLYLDKPLHLCEVHVFPFQSLRCGKPDFQPNCVANSYWNNGIQITEYTAKTGFKLEGPKVRKCKYGKWQNAAPICVSTGLSNKTNANTTTANKNGNNGFLVLEITAIIIMVPIVIILIYVVVMLLFRYYKKKKSESGIEIDDKQDDDHIYDTIIYEEIDDNRIPNKDPKSGAGIVNKTYEKHKNEDVEEEQERYCTRMPSGANLNGEFHQKKNGLQNSENPSIHLKNLKDENQKCPLNQDGSYYVLPSSLKEKSHYMDMTKKV